MQNPSKAYFYTLISYSRGVNIFQQNRNFIIILFFWLFTGMYLGPVVYAIIPITLVAMRSRNMFMEMLLGFFFILILSDSRQDSLRFAGTIKDFYMMILALFLLVDIPKFRPLSNVYRPFIAFFLIALICLFNAPPGIIGTSIEKTISYILLVIVIPSYTMKCVREQGVTFYKTLIYFGLSILGSGFILRFINPVQTLMEGRYRGILGNPNGLGIFLLLFFILVSVIIEFYPTILSRREKIIFYVLVFASLIFCDSRSSLFGVLIFLFFSYFYKISPFFGFVIFLVFAASYQFITTNIVSIVSSIGLGNYLRASTLEDASGRFFAWKFAWQNIQQNFYIGKGFEYTNYLFYISADYLETSGHEGNAHNSYLTLWLDTGLLGLLSYVAAFISQFFSAARNTKLALPVAYAVIFSSFFESWLTASLNPFTIQVFIILTILTSESVLHKKAEGAVPVQRVG